MRQFPYGNSNFYQVSTEGFFYIDRTDRIPQLEELGQQRPFMASQSTHAAIVSLALICCISNTW